MSAIMEPCFTLSLDGRHVWCPAPFRRDGRRYLALCAWPRSEGFEGWRSAARLALCELAGPVDRPAPVLVRRIEVAGHPFASLINPRVVVDGPRTHLFVCGVRDRVRYALAHADLGDLREGPVRLEPLDMSDRCPGAAAGQATNPAVLRCDDGRWRMIYRAAEGPGRRRSLHAAEAPAPTGPWTPLVDGPLVAPDADLEDPFLWMEDGVARGLVRDLGGHVTGRSWAAIGMMESVDWIDWRPSEDAHVCNRSTPGPTGAPLLMHRLERPARLPARSGVDVLFFASLESPDGASAIRGFGWRRTTPPTEDRAS